MRNIEYFSSTRNCKMYKQNHRILHNISFFFHKMICIYTGIPGSINSLFIKIKKKQRSVDKYEIANKL